MGGRCTRSLGPHGSLRFLEAGARERTSGSAAAQGAENREYTERWTTLRSLSLCHDAMGNATPPAAQLHRHCRLGRVRTTETAPRRTPGERLEWNPPVLTADSLFRIVTNLSPQFREPRHGKSWKRTLHIFPTDQ